MFCRDSFEKSMLHCLEHGMQIKWGYKSYSKVNTKSCKKLINNNVAFETKAGFAHIFAQKVYLQS